MAELTEVVAEVAEEVAEQATSVAVASRTLSQRDITLVVGGLSIGIAGGCIIGYFVTKRQLQTKYSELAEIEIAEMKRHFRAKEKAAKPELDEVMQNLGYKNEDEKEIVEEEILNTIDEDKSIRKFQNVFKPNDDIPLKDNWDYATEVKSRIPDVPYVIHADEYAQNEKNYTQTTLTYYEDDDVLSDERDNVIEDQDETIGLANLSKFGHGSNDVNIVYVRNDALEADYEVIRSTGSYAQEVHGFVQHSDSVDDSRRRSRRDWDG